MTAPDAPRTGVTPTELTPADPTGPEDGGRTTIGVVGVQTGMFGAQGSGDTSGYNNLVSPIVMPGPSDRPYGSWFDEAADVLAEVLEETGSSWDAAIEKVVVYRGELTLHVRR